MSAAARNRHAMPEGTPEGTMARQQASELAAKVYALVRACPSGRVTTYGWIANALELPRGGARVVGWILNETPQDAQVPAQRVINSKGELTGSWAFGQKGRMRALLEAEGIRFTPEGRVDLKRYGWDPARDLTPEEREAVLKQARQSDVDPSENLLRLLA